MTLKSLFEYGKTFQLKVLGALLTDTKFLLNVRDVLRVEYFDSEAHKWIIEQILKYFDKYHTVITLEVLKVELQKVNNEVLQVALKEELKHSYAASQDDLEYIEEEFSQFCRNQEMKAAILSSADLLKEGNFDGIRNRIEKALKAGTDKSIGHEYNLDIETRYREDYRKTIETPWKPLTDLFSGGFGSGDLAIFFGGPGSGKSWAMVAIAAHAAKLGYNVNYYTLELGDAYVGKRFDSYFTNTGINEIAGKRKEVQKIIDNLKGNIIVKEYPPKGASIHTIKAHVQKCDDLGYKPDLIVIDYLDYLRPPEKTKYEDRKYEIDDNYIAAKGLAKELEIPVLSPSQVNRAGAKDEVVEGDKAAGSYDKIMVSDIVMSLSRKKEDKVQGTGRIHVIKNRYGQDGMTYEILMDTDTGHIDFKGQFLESAEGNTEPYKNIADKFFALEK